MKSKLINFVVPLFSVIIAFVVGCLVIAFVGASPLDALKFLFIGAFGSKANIAATLVIATPLIFTGICACFAYRCGVFNLGGEGQFIIGACASIWVSVKWGIDGFPATLLCLAIGAIAGGIWGAIPGILKITRGLNEMIVSIMLNYVATLFMGLLYTSVMRDGSVPQTPAVPETIRISRIVASLRITYGIIIALVLAAIVHYFLFNTSKGFQLRAVGLNPIASEYNGLSVNRYILFSFIVSGAIAGLGGSVELLATQYRLMSGFGAGFGFDGVAMALIAQLNPLGTVIVSYFFAVLRTGATTMQVGTGVPTSVIDIIQALVIIFAVGSMAALNLPKVKQFFIVRYTKKKEAR